MRASTMEGLSTASEIAEVLCVTPKWVYSACRLYDMPYYQIGRYKRFSVQEILQWAEDSTCAERSITRRET